MLAPVALGAVREREREGGKSESERERQTESTERSPASCRGGGSRPGVAAGGLGNRTLCDFYRERANFAIELCQRQWQSARLLPGFSAWHFQQRRRRRRPFCVLQPSPYFLCLFSCCSDSEFFVRAIAPAFARVRDRSNVHQDLSKRRSSARKGRQFHSVMITRVSREYLRTHAYRFKLQMMRYSLYREARGRLAVHLLFPSVINN